MILFFQSLKSSSVIVPSSPEDAFDSTLTNSVDYDDKGSYIARSAFGQWNFTYAGTYLKIVVFTNISTESWPGFASIEIVINGASYQTVDFTSSTEAILTLPGGPKTISLIEGALTKGVDYLGTFLTEVHLSTNIFSKINETSHSEKYVFLGDSITNGFAPTNPQQETYSRLFYSDGSKNVACLGWGGATVEDLSGNSTLRDATITDIRALFTNTTTTKKLIILLGTNDWAEGNTPANVDTWYKDLIDTLNGLDSSIEMFCISPLVRSSNDSDLDLIRTNVGSMCDTRDFATHIEGKIILSYPTHFADTVHPNTTGHLTLYNSIKNTINA